MQCHNLHSTRLLKQCMQYRHKYGPAHGEFPEVIGKAPELLYRDSVQGHSPVLHNGNLLRVYMGALGTNDVAKGIQLRLDKLAFGQVSTHFMLT